jgi:hypothetical protein
MDDKKFIDLRVQLTMSLSYDTYSKIPPPSFFRSTFKMSNFGISKNELYSILYSNLQEQLQRHLEKKGI